MATVNPQQQKVVGLKFSSREIENIFSTKIHNFKLWKTPKIIKFQVSRGVIFFEL